MAVPIPREQSQAKRPWWHGAEPPSPEAVSGWVQAGLLAAVPWLEPWRPAWIPLILAAACLPSLPWRRHVAVDPWAAGGVVVSAVVWWAVNGGALVVVGWCALLALVVGLTWLQAAGSVASWPYLGHTLGLLGWGGAIAVRPELLSWQRGGWIAALLAVVVAPRLVAKRRADSAGEQGRALGPPRREVEGRLALDQVVLGDGAGLTLTPPWDVRIAAGESLALLCDDGPIREAVVAVMAGLRPPVSGRVVIDGVPLEPDDRLVAVVAPGDPFIAGSLVANLGALAGRELEPAQVRAAVESCGLSDARDRLGEGDLDPSGAPLEPAERMLVAVGRALVSHARIVVVADPRPWVDEAAAEQWRRAIVRASVGRTALWLTTDRQLARRADRRGTVTGGRIDWDHGARP